MDLPTRQGALCILKKQGVESNPYNLLDHSLAVNKLAVWLARQLKSAGIDVAVELVDRASLLHDIGRLIDTSENEKLHDVRGRDYLKDKYPALAKAVLRHVCYRVHECENWEEKLVLYADMRVKRTQYVSLKERLAYIRKKYFAGREDELERHAAKVRKLEKELFGLIGKSPDELFK